MKKLISILLVVCVLFSAMPLAVAFNTKPTVACNDPTIYIAGDSGKIYYDNGTKYFSIDDMFALIGLDSENETDDEEEGDGENAVLEAAINILIPFILEGIASGKWDNYYAAVEKEIGEIFEPIKLDENGNIPEGTVSGIGPSEQNHMNYTMTHNVTNGKGQYDEKAYNFYYDWRLDPMELADELHKYIEAVKKATGHNKVSLNCRCLGSNVAMAYIYKYGIGSISNLEAGAADANFFNGLKGLGIDVSTSNGSDFLSGIISGDFGIDGNAIVRFIADTAYFEDSFDVSPVITTTIELLANTGVLDKLTDVARKELYAEIEYGIISALATATFLTMPCYWALVAPEDFDTALTYVFGEKGSEKRTKYAGLIEKITYYNDTIKVNTEEILKVAKGAGTNMCIIAKYGVQMLPVLKDSSVLGDQYVSAGKASFGATTSDVYGTLDEEYIAERVALGYEDYISPDKQIDASTCLFPEYTWFIKGCSHGFYSTCERDLLLTTIDADRQLTVDDFPYTRFIVYNYAENTFTAMTEENCDIGSWDAEDEIENPQTKPEKTTSLLVSLMRWLTAIFNAIRGLFTGK